MDIISAGFVTAMELGRKAGREFDIKRRGMEFPDRNSRLLIKHELTRHPGPWPIIYSVRPFLITLRLWLLHAFHIQGTQQEHSVVST